MLETLSIVGFELYFIKYGIMLCHLLHYFVFSNIFLLNSLHFLFLMAQGRLFLHISCLFEVRAKQRKRLIHTQSKKLKKNCKMRALIFMFKGCMQMMIDGWRFYKKNHQSNKSNLLIYNTILYKIKLFYKKFFNIFHQN